MDSAVCCSPRELQPGHRPIPRPPSREAPVQIRACDACGTGIHSFEGNPGAAGPALPAVLGHEVSSIAAKAGSQATFRTAFVRVPAHKRLRCHRRGGPAAGEHIPYIPQKDGFAA